jgi:hypothetical protein
MQSLLKFKLLFLVVAVGAALFIAPAYAQTTNRVVVNIPFDFSVGTNSLNAGSYAVDKLQSGILVFSSIDGQRRWFGLTVRGDSANRSEQPRLVFTRYGSESFLNEVFFSADNEYELVVSSREKELGQHHASGEKLSLLIPPAR